VTIDEVHQIVGSRLLRVDQRYTPTRRMLITTLHDAGQPLTIPAILDGEPALAQSSVYRNLTVLEGAGAVARVVGGDEWTRYELAADLIGHHHHLVCTSCGDVVDISLPREAEALLEQQFDELARSHGFAITEHRLDLVGTCRPCSS
jgi:Fur family transcriptional regulator, ferric uptake regulator